jgi:hypothetical protein
MQRGPVSSSNVASVGYDEATSTLEIEFLSGQVYQYFDVPEDVHTSLMYASSVGSFLAHNIKNKYQYQKV